MLRLPLKYTHCADINSIVEVVLTHYYTNIFRSNKRPKSILVDKSLNPEKEFKNINRFAQKEKRVVDFKTIEEIIDSRISDHFKDINRSINWSEYIDFYIEHIIIRQGTISGIDDEVYYAHVTCRNHCFKIEDNKELNRLKLKYNLDIKRLVRDYD